MLNGTEKQDQQQDQQITTTTTNTPQSRLQRMRAALGAMSRNASQTVARHPRAAIATGSVVYTGVELGVHTLMGNPQGAVYTALSPIVLGSTIELARQTNLVQRSMGLFNVARDFTNSFVAEISRDAAQLTADVIEATTEFRNYVGGKRKRNESQQEEVAVAEKSDKKRARTDDSAEKEALVSSVNQAEEEEVVVEKVVAESPSQPTTETKETEEFDYVNSSAVANVLNQFALENTTTTTTSSTPATDSMIVEEDADKDVVKMKLS